MTCLTGRAYERVYGSGNCTIVTRLEPQDAEVYQLTGWCG
jgi:hypothetical protein